MHRRALKRQPIRKARFIHPDAIQQRAQLVDIGPEPPHRPAPPGGSEKTSVSVHPFTEHGNAGPASFGPGLAEDIAIELGRFSTLTVAGAGADAAATYAVRGSIRYSGDRVRISVQLLDGSTTDLIWAERYDRRMTDGFALHDDITSGVVAALPGRVQADVAERAARCDIDALGAHELMLRGKMLRDVLSADAMVEARGLLERAVALDPQNARAHMYLSDTYVIDGWLGLNDDQGAGHALRHARLAIAADPSDVFVQDHLGFAFLSNGMWRDGRVQIEKTLRQIGNEVESNAWCGYALSLLGDHEDTLREVLKSTARDPLPPAAFGWIRGQVFSLNDRYEAAIAELMGASNLNSLAQAFLVGGYARLGRADDAAIALDNFVTLRRSELRSRHLPDPARTVAALAGGFRAMWRRQQDWDHIATGLALAGLPN